MTPNGRKKAKKANAIHPKGDQIGIQCAPASESESTEGRVRIRTFSEKGLIGDDGNDLSWCGFGGLRDVWRVCGR
jgi:hypothetical protein